jgi:hypothetical protein
VFTDLGGSDYITALALAPNGWIYAAGKHVKSNDVDMALAQYTPEGKLASCPNPANCRNWPNGTFFVNVGTSDSANAIDLRDDNQLVVAGCINKHFAGVQVRTDGAPVPLPLNTDLLGDDCAKAVRFVGADKIVMAGNQDLYPYRSDTNIALARFQTTAEQPTPVPAPRNMVANPGFELDANNDKRPDRWTLTPSNAPVTRDAGEHRGGTYSLRAGPSALPSYMVTQRVPGIIAGATYSFGSYVFVSNTTDSFTFDVEVRWRSATNTVISTARIRRFTGSLKEWTLAASSIPAPTGATSAEVAFVATSLQTSVYVDDVSFALTSRLKNGAMEFDQNGDTRPDDWSVTATMVANVTRDGSVRRSGSYAMRHAPAANASYNVGQVVTGLSAGQSYVMEGWVNIPSTSDAFTMELRVLWRDASGAIVGGNTVKTFRDDTAGAWKKAAAVIAAPPGAVTALVQMRALHLNATVYVDDLVFRP